MATMTANSQFKMYLILIQGNFLLAHVFFIRYSFTSFAYCPNLSHFTYHISYLFICSELSLYHIVQVMNIDQRTDTQFL